MSYRLNEKFLENMQGTYPHRVITPKNLFRPEDVEKQIGDLLAVPLEYSVVYAFTQADHAERFSNMVKDRLSKMAWYEAPTEKVYISKPS